MAGQVVTLPPPAEMDRTPSPEGQARPWAVSVQSIRFVDTPPMASLVIREYRDPYPRVAVADVLDLAHPAAAEKVIADPEGLVILFLPSGHATPYEWQKWAEERMAAESDGSGPPLIELTVQSDRVWWRTGRALVVGAPDRRDGLTAALTDFAFFEGELRKLEREVERGLRVAEDDIHFTHQVARADVKRWDHIKERTATVTHLRMRFVRLEPHLEKSSPDLPGPARRLYSELVLQADVADRLEYLDDKLEVLEDLYELANDRLSEFSYFNREFRLEMAIVVILFVEVLVMLWEIYVVTDQ